MWGLLSDVLDDLLEGPLPAVHLYDLYAVQHLVQQVDPSVALLGGYSPVFWQETGLKLGIATISNKLDFDSGLA